MKLDVLICCFNHSINRLDKVLLSPRGDVQYIIAHQYEQPEFKTVPVFLNRPDVKVFQSYGKGLSKNRNVALRNGAGEICLIADDDVAYTHDFFDIIIKSYQQHPDKDVLLFKIRTMAGEPEYKAYPDGDYLLTRKEKKHYLSSIEISFRRNSLSRQGIFFDERFGLGSEYFSSGGEEGILIDDCLKRGLKVYFINEYIVNHPFISTGKAETITTAKFKSELAYYFRTMGPVFLLYLIFRYKHFSYSRNIFKCFTTVCVVCYILWFKKHITK